MSQDNYNQLIKNYIQISSNNSNNNDILNNFDLNLNEIKTNEDNLLNNNISKISYTNNLSNNNFFVNNEINNLLFQDNLKDFKSSENNINSLILLLYKELILNIKEENIYLNDFKNEYNKIKNILNNINKDYDNNKLYESIIDIFKESLIKIIDIKTKNIIEKINQFKSTILLLEKNNRYYIQQNFLKQTKIDILENEIDSYMEMEEEFDEMKEKLKYENGKFLHNEKKENEILILRAENTNLKKVIDKNEKTIEEKDHLIEVIKNKSTSMFNTNINTIKNSFELNDNEHNQGSSLIFIQNNQKSKINHNNSNITNFKSYNIIKKLKSPNNNNFKTNNNSQSSKKKLFGENMNNYAKNKKKNSTSRTSTKELINKKLKNKILNMKKIRRINDNCLDNYNKSSAYITNSLMNISSNNTKNKRMKKNSNFFYKNNIFNRVNKIHKKLSSGVTSSNLNDLIKNNSNKIIVNSILDNNNSNNNNNNNSFFYKTSTKKFAIPKQNSKTNIKKQNDNYLLIRNNNSLIKSPTTFNHHNPLDNNIGMKNNIIINNIIQNTSSIPISSGTNKSKEKKNVYDNELNKYFKNDSNDNKYSSIFTKKDKDKKYKK